MHAEGLVCSQTGPAPCRCGSCQAWLPSACPHLTCGVSPLLTETYLCTCLRSAFNKATCAHGLKMFMEGGGPEEAVAEGGAEPQAAGRRGSGQRLGCKATPLWGWPGHPGRARTQQARPEGCAAPGPAGSPGPGTCGCPLQKASPRPSRRPWGSVTCAPGAGRRQTLIGDEQSKGRSSQSKPKHTAKAKQRPWGHVETREPRPSLPPRTGSKSSHAAIQPGQVCN